MPVSKFNLKFEVRPFQKERIPTRYDILSYRNNKQAITGKIDIRSLQSGRWINRFSSLRVSGPPQIFSNRFGVFSLQNSKSTNRYDVVCFVGAGRVVISYDSLRPFSGKITNRFQIDSAYVARTQYVRIATVRPRGSPSLLD